MKPVLIILSLQLLLTGRGASLPQGVSTDPCDDAPCGKGAECKSMGSIAICVCPNDGTGDPFVACMQQMNETESPPNHHKPQHQFVTSFDVGSVHQSRASLTTVKPSSSSPSSTTTSKSSPSTTPSTTTTRNPSIHIYDSSTPRPATIGGHSNSNSDPNQPESHRIPIINHNSNYPHHDYAPRPFGGSTPPPYPYHGSSSSSYDPFNEKIHYPGSGPIADYGSGTTPYIYRGSATHLSGSHNAYEYDSRPITPTTSSYYNHHSHSPHYSNNIDRYGHHGYHPSSSGFPDPITESSSSYSRYGSSNGGGVGSFYDIYNYNRVRNDLPSSSGSYDRIADPMGKYENCRSVNGIVLCADTNSYRHSHNPPSMYDQGEMRSTTTNYGFHSNRDRDQYSSYYPSRYGSTSSRPMTDYYDVNRQGYPYHESRTPIDSDRASSNSYYTNNHPFLPKEQRIQTQSTLTITSSSSDSAALSPTSRNDDSDHPLCKSMCGINSVCRLVLERPVCGCPEGHTGDPSVRCSPTSTSSGSSSVVRYQDNNQDKEECQRHVDCRQSEICAKGSCIDPCKEQGMMSSSSVNFIGVGGNGGGESICGSNAECLVVGHTPVCKCNHGYFGNPYVACVP